MDKCNSCKGKHSSVVELDKAKKALAITNDSIKAIDEFTVLFASSDDPPALLEKAKAAKIELEGNKKIIEKRIKTLEAPEGDDEEEEDEEPEGDNEDYPPEGKRKPRGTDNEDY